MKIYSKSFLSRVPEVDGVKFRRNHPGQVEGLSTLNYHISHLWVKGINNQQEEIEAKSMLMSSKLSR